MNNSSLNPQIILRITTLWAFSEAFLGGILHGFKIPFAGLFLSLIAAICITIIAIHSEQQQQILTATLLVIVLKFILSPHTPPMAYFAVLLEGLFGALLLSNMKSHPIRRNFAIFMLSLFCLMYSAFQHLLLLTLIFGQSFWKAIDIFLNKITAIFIKNPHQYSLYLVTFYVGCHLIVGILGGILNIKITKYIQNKPLSPPILTAYEHLKQYEYEKEDNPISTVKNKQKSISFIPIILFFLLLFSYLPFFSNTLMKDKVLEIVIRGSLIMLVWNYFLAPILRRWTTKWLKQYKRHEIRRIEQVLSLLPDIQKIVHISWLLTKEERHFKKYGRFLMTAFLLTLQIPTPSVSSEKK